MKSRTDFPAQKCWLYQLHNGFAFPGYEGLHFNTFLQESKTWSKTQKRFIIQAMAASEELLALKFIKSSPEFSPVFSDCSKFKRTEDDKPTEIFF